jgi:pimeloyl-ACP methyl ester carboxylesterase
MPIKPVSNEYVIAGDTTLHYVQWGKEGTPVICIHGLTANAFSFQAFADALAPTHCVFAYDLRGHGDSDKPEEDYNIPAHAQDLAEMIDELGVERPIILGHSFGAMIAVYFAAHYPDKLSKLVLLDGGAPIPGQTLEELPEWLLASINRVGTATPSYRQYIEDLQAIPFLGSHWNEYIELSLRNDIRPEHDGSIVAKAYREGIIEEGQHIHEIRLDQLWARITVPTLLLRAGQGLFSATDQMLSEDAAQAMQEHIPDCQYINFPELNHYTLIFGVVPGPIQEIQQFLDKG